MSESRRKKARRKGKVSHLRDRVDRMGQSLGAVGADSAPSSGRAVGLPAEQRLTNEREVLDHILHPLHGCVEGYLFLTREHSLTMVEGLAQTAADIIRDVMKADGVDVLEATVRLVHDAVMHPPEEGFMLKPYIDAGCFVLLRVCLCSKR